MTVPRDFDPNNDPYMRAFCGWPPLVEWIREHGVEPRDVRRIQFDTDRGVATFHRYAHDADGRKFVDETGEAPAMLPPLDVPMRSAPPDLDIRQLVGRSR